MSRRSASVHRPVLERLEDRCLLDGGGFASLPVVPVIDANTKAHLQNVLAIGVQQGDRLDTFIKVGDSITALPNFLTPLGSPDYNPTDPAVAGDYTSLAPTINYFRVQAVDGTSANSFDRTSLSAHAGWGTADVLKPETLPLLNELVAVRPAFALIELGTNEVGSQVDPAAFAGRVTQIAETVLSSGAVPVLCTIPDLLAQGGALESRVAIFNQVIADVAARLDVPLWNSWAALHTLPNLGLDATAIHPSSDPAGTGLFTPDALQYGFNVRNLTAVQVLDKLKRVLLDNGAADGAPTAPAATPPGPLSANVIVTVDHLYQTLLGRFPGPAEVEYWGRPLQNGGPARDAAQGIWQSAEHRGREVDQLYAQLLHHAPDPAGRGFWVSTFQAGATEDDVRLDLVTSGEYVAAHPSVPQFMVGIYQDLLGRTLDPGAPNLDSVQDADGRRQVVQILLNSREGEGHVLGQYYTAYLGRAADPAAQGYWLALRQAGMLSEEGVAESLLASAEFAQGL